MDKKPGGCRLFGLTTTSDLPPAAGKHGTVSILAGIDLHSGQIFANTEDRHRILEFIGLLKAPRRSLPGRGDYPRRARQPFYPYFQRNYGLSGQSSGRFKYVHTPKQCTFSKMSRIFHRHIRVESIDELKTRMLKGIEEINTTPVIFRWNKFDKYEDRS